MTVVKMRRPMKKLVWSRIWLTKAAACGVFCQHSPAIVRKNSSPVSAEEKAKLVFTLRGLTIIIDPVSTMAIRSNASCNAKM